MMYSHARRIGAFAVLAAAAVLLAACAPSSMVQQQTNPEYAGKKVFKRILVIGGAKDDLARRVFEDDAVARLKQRGIQGVPGYSVLPRPGPIGEAQIRKVVAQTGVDGVLMSRVIAVNTATLNTGGYTAFVGVGYGGFYGFYDGFWEAVNVPVTTTSGPTTTVSDTRLFDARNGAMVWSGIVDTQDRDRSLASNLQQYIGVVFDAMIQAGVI